jgi:hypothetical protein
MCGQAVLCQIKVAQHRIAIITYSTSAIHVLCSDDLFERQVVNRVPRPEGSDAGRVSLSSHNKVLRVLVWARRRYTSGHILI